MAGKTGILLPRRIPRRRPWPQPSFLRRASSIILVMTSVGTLAVMTRGGHRFCCSGFSPRLSSPSFAISSSSLKRRPAASRLTAVSKSDNGNEYFDYESIARKVDNEVGTKASNWADLLQQEEQQQQQKDQQKLQQKQQQKKQQRQYVRPSPSLRVRPSHLKRDVVIVGGSLAGLSCALRLALVGDRHVTVLDDGASMRSDGGAVASRAAAGMLAPFGERLPNSALLDLCVESRDMYAGWVRDIEEMARVTPAEGRRFWSEKDGAMEAWEVGYVQSGGFVAPAFAGDSVSGWAPPEQSGAVWLDDLQVRELEPNLSPDVIGGWWFPEDASVDSRRLTNSLRAACITAGVSLCIGPDHAVSSLELRGGTCMSISTSSLTYESKTVLLANGAWMRHLLPLPLVPHKGQSFALRPRPGQNLRLDRVLFGQDTYVVPKADGRIVVGATVEPNLWDSDVTPAGTLHCLSAAMRLIPALAEAQVVESWAGLRPTTPDRAPLLGKTRWDNLHLAGGYWRNGVLLAPRTAELVVDGILGTEGYGKENDDIYLEAFRWDRFTDPEGGDKIAAMARWAAASHPVHYRSEGSASVGTELGVYDGAAAAKDERAEDRGSILFGGSDKDMEATMEAAAQAGIRDAVAYVINADNEEGGGESVLASESTDTFDEYSFDPQMPNANESVVTPQVDSEVSAERLGSPLGDENGETFNSYVAIESEYASMSFEEGRQKMEDARIRNRSKGDGAIDMDQISVELSDYEKDVDDTIPMLNDDAPIDKEFSNEDLNTVYENIRSNKAVAAAEAEAIIVRTDTNPSGDSGGDERPVLPFNIFYVDSETEEEILVPQYTNPDAFLKDRQNKEKIASSGESDAMVLPEDEENEKTFDGYVAIESEYAGMTFEETRKKMAEARIRNRAGGGSGDDTYGGDSINIDQIGVFDEAAAGAAVPFEE